MCSAVSFAELQSWICLKCCSGSERLGQAHISIFVHLPSILLNTAWAAHTFIFKTTSLRAEPCIRERMNAFSSSYNPRRAETSWCSYLDDTALG